MLAFIGMQGLKWGMKVPGPASNAHIRADEPVWWYNQVQEGFDLADLEQLNQKMSEIQLKEAFVPEVGASSPKGPEASWFDIHVLSTKRIRTSLHS